MIGNLETLQDELADNMAVARIELDREATTAFDALAQDATA
ncbi:hypothetical protein [Micromonospora carbonacea]